MVKAKYLNGNPSIVRQLSDEITLLFLTGPAFSSPTPTFWSDSYDPGDGICRCDSSYDHGINTTMVNTPCGQKSVPEVCALITEKYGVGPVGNRTYYNTVQCGHQPYNNVVDETLCPGIPQNTSNWTGPRCQETGVSVLYRKFVNRILIVVIVVGVTVEVLFSFRVLLPFHLKIRII